MLHSAVIVVGALASGCGVDEDYSQIESFATVQSYTTTSCTTAVVIGLSKQISDEIGCANPTGLVKFAAGGKLQITNNSVLPYLASKAKTDLMAVTANTTVQINSAFRTVAQQYLLYRWFQLGRCGITAAATPGTSNHESGRALDVQNYSAVIGAMGAKGWSHDIPGDPVHFDHLASPDIRGRDVLAFQKLWNRNNPNDKIAEDGDYGPQTEARLRQSPSEGFPIGPSCAPGARDVDVVSVDGPDRASPQTRVHYAITVKNSGMVTLPETTKLALKSATKSVLHDDSWTSETVITTLGAAIEAGKTGTIDFDVTTPATDVELPIMEELVLDDGGTKFGEIQLALTVVPGMTGEESGEGSEEEHDHGDAGGCNAGGNSSGLLLLFALVGLVRRRR
jgi:uncharacterized protein (TIGR03382 family)